MTVGDRVVITKGPRKGEVATIVGFRGLTHAVLAFGGGDYDEIALDDLRKTGGARP